MIKQGIIELDGKHSIFLENYAFTSPSAAGAILNGRSTNGRTEWKHKKTKKLITTSGKKTSWQKQFKFNTLCQCVTINI